MLNHTTHIFGRHQVGQNVYHVIITIPELVDFQWYPIEHFAQLLMFQGYPIEHFAQRLKFLGL